MNVLPGVRWLRVDDGIVIFSPSARRFVDLNESAAELWDRSLASDWSVDIIIRDLVSEYDLAWDEARALVSAFVADLTRNGVVSPD